MDIRVPSISRSTQLVIMFLAVVFITCLAGCGSKSGSAGTNPSNSSDLRIAGVFLTTNNEAPPISTVTILNTGDSCTTDAQGNCEINTDSITGDIEVEVAGSWGSNRFVLAGISVRAESITFQVRVNPSIQEAKVVWQNVEEESTSLPPTVVSLPPDRCALCHELHQFTNCTVPSWIELHQGIYNCEAEGEISPVIIPDPAESPEEESDPSDNPTKSPTPKPTPKKDPDDKYKTGLCVSCHSFRGTPKCGSSSWTKQHNFYSCGNNPGKDKDDKKKKKKKALGPNATELVSFLQGLQ